MPATATLFRAAPAFQFLRVAACGLAVASAAAWAQVPQPTPPAAATPMKPPTAATAPAATSTTTPAPTPATTTPATPPAPVLGTTPDNRTAPLVTVPLGRTAADPAAGAASAGTTTDGMARCKAMPAGPARDDCVRRARITAPAR